MTPFMTPTKASCRPKSVVKVMIMNSFAANLSKNPKDRKAAARYNFDINVARNERSNTQFYEVFRSW
jgi:hypothetical protein